jgi:hypothetical protein
MTGFTMPMTRFTIRQKLTPTESTALWCEALGLNPQWVSGLSISGSEGDPFHTLTITVRYPQGSSVPNITAQETQ